MLFQSGHDKRFFDLLRASAANIRESVRVFGEMTENLSRSNEYATKIKILEKEGDRYTHDVLALLNSMFITPLEREDILALAQELDDVVDGIEAAASRMAIYQVTESDEHIRAFTRILAQQTEEIAAAVDRLGSKNMLGIREHNVRIKAWEKEGDAELRHCLAELFSGLVDPVQLIKMKEIYETLEATTDRAEDVADTLESVVMKNV